ncbi:alanine racemase [Defluviimonas sp. WL0002]|uniref:Alanine racemase n=1 Tax=Albidovulum marisflavi TaxID=2984159 RepID=A0ABT2ZFB1_9RHOB|nr:alanine racemase [Defluviimonas sp. WL0002]MCV2869828.1 alanine racemase [Defluviimonas sp. WL0002]
MTQASLTIDLDAIAANWGALARLSGSAEAGAVVKADAYGLGDEKVATRLMAEGAFSFFVAETQEGVRLRQALGPTPEIYVFTGHMAGDADAIKGARLIPLLNSPEQVIRHRAALPDHPFGVQLDTGMNRLGMEEDDWKTLAPELLPHSPQLLMSHLACSDEPDHPMNAHQLAVFHRMTDGTGVRRSLSATGGILLGPDYHFDLTRPGIGSYGGQPFSEAQPVVHLSLPVVQTRTVEAGETVGYGNSWTAPRTSRVATVAAGYADGLLRSLTGRGRLYAGDRPCPLVGRVSMDLMGVDVTDLPEAPETLDILCPAQGVDELADAAGTIGYEILTSLGGRYARRYTGTGA